jgi:putative membrane protein
MNRHVALARPFGTRPARRIARRPMGGRKAAVPGACLVIFALIWAVLAIAPRYRADWVLENLLTFLAVPLAVVTFRRFRFSDQAYVQMMIVLLLNTVGSHYTYSEVPIGDWARDAFGLARNHYDRVVHFAFGLLMLRPTRELIVRRPRTMGRWTLAFVSVAATSFWSVTYELIEWIVAALADPAAGTAYLGTQGDVWDAQKDMALAAAGAIVAAFVDARQVRR